MAYVKTERVNGSATFLPLTTSRSSTPPQPSVCSSTVGSDSEMAIELRNLKAWDSQNESEDEHTHVQEDLRIRSRSRYIWTVCAAVSLISSKYLLVDLNVHYPLHIHLIQLAAATLLTLVQLRWQPSQPSNDEAPRPSMLGWVFLVLLTSLMAGAAVLNLQAILHFQNITTLVMISMISYLVKLVIAERSRFRWLRCLILALACVGILRGEYRLLVRGLMSSIPAALLAGLAGALYTLAADSSPSTVSNSARINLLFCISGIVITTTWALNAEDTLGISAFLASIKGSYLPVMALNAFTTALAIMLGKSFLFPIHTIKPGQAPESHPEVRLGDAITALALSGVIGCATTLTLRRSYMTYLQMFAFFVALLCIGGHSAFDVLRQWMGKDGRRGYTMVPPSSGLESMDSENTMVSGEPSGVLVSSSLSHRANKPFVRTLIVGLIVTSLWLVFPILNFQEVLHVKKTIETPHLDLSYTPTLGAELVISMYKEPIPDVAHLISTLRSMPSLQHAAVHIYVKDDQASVSDIKSLTGATNVTKLPNVGREGETYLYHILNEWDRLAKHTVFLQADVHNPREFYPRVRDFYDPERTGMMSLGWSGNVCDCEDCGDRWSFKDTTHLFPSIHGRIYNSSTTCSTIMLSYKGQFIASAGRIRGIDKSIYDDLRNAFVDEDSWAHHESYLKGREDSMSAPFFGYTMERMWNLLMQCSSTDVSWKCPTLLSGDRLGGSIEDCQCFDN